MRRHYANVGFMDKRIEEKRIGGEQRSIKKKGENDRKAREKSATHHRRSGEALADVNIWLSLASSCLIKKLQKETKKESKQQKEEKNNVVQVLF